MGGDDFRRDTRSQHKWHPCSHAVTRRPRRDRSEFVRNDGERHLLDHRELRLSVSGLFQGLMSTKFELQTYRKEDFHGSPHIKGLIAWENDLGLNVSSA